MFLNDLIAPWLLISSIFAVLYDFLKTIETLALAQDYENIRQ